MSREREALLRMYGATVEVVESLGGMGEAVGAARALAAEPDHFLPDQFSNPANPEAHRTGTGPEILKAMDGKVDIFVAGVGTGGTITGAGEAIKAKNPKAQVIAVEPQSSAVLSGRAAGPAPHPGHRRRLRPVGAQPRDPRRGHRRPRRGRDRDRAPAPRRARACSPGLSCGAALWGAMQVAARPESKGKRIVVRPARLGRALHLRAVLRAAGLTRLGAGPRGVRIRGVLGLGTLRRVAGELRCDVRAAHERDPAARGVSSLEILVAWPGVHALLAHRVAHALQDAGRAGRPALDRVRQPRADRASRSTRRPTSATGSSSTTAPAS